MEKDPPCPDLIEGAPSSKNFEAGFTVDLMLKDMSLAVSALMSLGIPCPTGAAANQVYRMASRDGLGELDFAAVAMLTGAAERPR